jgi:hypothetical protein
MECRAKEACSGGRGKEARSGGYGKGKHVLAALFVGVVANGVSGQNNPGPPGR